MTSVLVFYPPVPMETLGDGISFFKMVDSVYSLTSKLFGSRRKECVVEVSSLGGIDIRGAENHTSGQ